MTGPFTLRQDKIKNVLQQKNLDALLLFSLPNIRYLSNYSGEIAHAVITHNKNYLITDYRFIEDAQNECSGFELICRDRKNDSVGDVIARIIQQEGIETIGFESSHISVQAWQALKQEASIAQAIAVDGVIESHRQIKDNAEIEHIRCAAHIADCALEKLLPQFKEGVSERDMALELEYQMYQLGSEKPAFPTILLFAEKSSLPHGHPDNAKLKYGDIILIDFGASVQGYGSDMTRSFIFGKADEQQKSVYHSVLQAQQKAIETLKSGAYTDDAHAASCEVLKQSPYAQYAGEGLGHGLGLQLHEQPFIGMSANHQLQIGNIVTIEPGIYIPHWGGIRLEDDMLVTENGCDFITRAPKPFEI